MAEKAVTVGEKTSFRLGWGDRKAQGRPGAPRGMLAEILQTQERGRECYFFKLIGKRERTRRRERGEKH